MIDVDEAWGRIAALARPLPAASCAVAEAAGRVVAAGVAAPDDLPGFDRSAMDGWTLRAADLAAAGDAGLVLAGDVAAGSAGDEPLAPAHAAGISTGAPIPPGADSVLRREAGELRDGRLRATEPVAPGDHVRRRGEDVRAGESLLEAGMRVTAGRLGVLASAGVADLDVHRRPRVAIAATGSELVAPGGVLAPGQIHESNGAVLRALAGAAGADAHDLGIVPDDRAATAAALADGLERADVLLVSGGVSVGEHDHVRPELERLGVQELFWRVRMKPGKPVFCGRAGERWVFGLPGNPLSTVATFLVFVEPLLRRLAGEADATARLGRARLAVASSLQGGRTTYATATLRRSEDGTLLATPTAKQGSHMTKALADADAFAVLPHETPELAAGAEVRILEIPAV